MPDSSIPEGGIMDVGDGALILALAVGGPCISDAFFVTLYMGMSLLAGLSALRFLTTPA